MAHCARLGAVAYRAGGSRGFATTRAWRWGNPVAGTFGSKTPEVQDTPLEIPKPNDGEFTSVAVGTNHSAFVCNGEVYSWGSKEYGVLGHSGVDNRNPTKVEFDGVPLAISLGDYHSSILTKDGKLYNWGWGGSFLGGCGALGLGDKTATELPTLVDTLDDVRVSKMSCGQAHMLALGDDNQVYATGSGEYGKLGLGDTQDEASFAVVDFLDEQGEKCEIKKVQCASSFSGALSTEGKLFLWGRNDQGQMGLGEESMVDIYSVERTPIPVKSHQFLDFAVGASHVVALTDSNEVYIWGARTWLDPRKIVPSLEERSGDADSIPKIVKVAAGNMCSFLVTECGQMWTWGQAKNKTMGIGGKENILQPTRASPDMFDGGKVIDLVVGQNRAAAITQH